MRFKKIILFTFLGLFVLFFYSPIFEKQNEVNAATENISAGTEIDWPSSPLSGISLNKKTEIVEFIIYIYEWAVGLSGLFLFAVFLYSGVEYLLYSGYDPTKLKESKNRIKKAIGAVLFLLSIYLILYTVNPGIIKMETLPSLWEDEKPLENLPVENSATSIPPCEFAILYTERNFQGNESQRIAINGEIKASSLPNNEKYMSAKGFRKKSKYEEEMEENGAIGEKIILDETYIEGENCLLKVSVEKSVFLFWGKYESVVGVIPLPSNNLEQYFHLEKENEKEFIYRIDG
jgi:hypothetical protein